MKDYVLKLLILNNLFPIDISKYILYFAKEKMRPRSYSDSVIVLKNTRRDKHFQKYYCKFR